MYDPSGDTLSFFSLETQASAAPSVYTKYSKGSHWSHAQPEPLSIDVPPTMRDQATITSMVEKMNQGTQYEENPHRQHPIKQRESISQHPSTLQPESEVLMNTLTSLKFRQPMVSAVDSETRHKPTSPLPSEQCAEYTSCSPQQPSSALFEQNLDFVTSAGLTPTNQKAPSQYSVGEFISDLPIFGSLVSQVSI